MVTGKVIVQKRDGTREEFDPHKIARVVEAAGLKKDQAHGLAQNIHSWVYASDHKTLTSLRIRDKVLEELAKINTYAADLFRWYQKTKEGQLDR